MSKLAVLLGFAVLSAWATAQTQPTAGTPASQNVKVLGKLGQAVSNIKMRVSMSSKARVISSAKAFQYLVVSDSGYNAWKKVLLSNGRHAFVASDQVAILPYQVTVPLTSKSGKLPPVKGGGAPVAGGDAANWVVSASYQYIGTRYVWGGNSLTGGIDCSGFVKELYKQVGVSLPRTAREQARVGKPITQMEDLQAGDRLYFWDKKRGYIGHTGIFLGYKDGHAFFIHSSTNNKGVDTDDLLNAKWRKMLVAARR